MQQVMGSSDTQPCELPSFWLGNLWSNNTLNISHTCMHSLLKQKRLNLLFIQTLIGRLENIIVRLCIMMWGNFICMEITPETTTYSGGVFPQKFCFCLVSSELSQWKVVFYCALWDSYFNITYQYLSHNRRAVIALLLREILSFQG